MLTMRMLSVCCTCFLLSMRRMYLHLPIHIISLFETFNIFKASEYKVLYDSPDKEEAGHKHTSCDLRSECFIRNDIRNSRRNDDYKKRVCVLPWGEMCLERNIKIAFTTPAEWVWVKDKAKCLKKSRFTFLVFINNSFAHCQMEFNAGCFSRELIKVVCFITFAILTR